MRKPKLLEDYIFLTHDSVSPFAHSVVRQTSTSDFITNGTALTTALQAAVVALDTEVAAIDHPTPAQTANRDLLRSAVTNELGRLGKRLNLDYPADEVALLSSGLTLAASHNTNSANRQSQVDTLVMEIDLLDGSQPGCLLVKLKRPTGAVQTLLRYATDAALPEENWLVAVGGGRERQLGPFASGTKVWVKAAGLAGSTTEPVYSGVKARIVQ